MSRDRAGLGGVLAGVGVVAGVGIVVGALAACRAREESPPPEAPVTSPELRASAPEVASYTLRARLDAERHAIQGEGEIRWLNTSSRPIDELYFHLYLNAFEGPDTLFYRSATRRARGGKKPERWGHIRIERLVARQLADADLLPALEPYSPGDPQDGTDRRLPLPRPIAPGETLALDVAWSSELPELRVRTGYSGDFHFAGQWFPKLARLEPDGTWAHFAFDPLSEFYADFGAYDVTLDVPEAMVVGATGRRVSEQSSGGRRTLRYRADDVHDFAWTAWPHFEQRDERIDDVDVHLLVPSGHGRNADATLAVLRQALPHFGARYGRYPYSDLTVVHPPERASNAGGMEYPTLITTGGPWHLSYYSRAVEFVTVHELGHQWFYGLLASNEQRWPFLDEGLNSYAESAAMEAFFGPASASTVLGFSLSGEALRRYVMLAHPHAQPIARSAAEFANLQELGGVVYQRTTALLQTIANVYGEAALRAGLGRYAERFRFRHPTPEDLLATLAETLSPGAVDNLRGALLEGHGVDYELASLESEPLPPGPGAPGFESRISVRRHGALRFPVRLTLRTESGEQFEDSWDGQADARVFTYRRPSAVVSAVVDPDARVRLDENLLNNARRSTPEAPLSLYERSAWLLHGLGELLAP